MVSIVRHAGKMLLEHHGVPMTSATFAVSKLQYHENRARLWRYGLRGGGIGPFRQPCARGIIAF